MWEGTSFRLEQEQSAVETVEQEQRGLAAREAPQWNLPYTPTWTPEEALAASDKPRVAVLRCSANCDGRTVPMCCSSDVLHSLYKSDWLVCCTKVCSSPWVP